MVVAGRFCFSPPFSSIFFVCLFFCLIVPILKSNICVLCLCGSSVSCSSIKWNSIVIATAGRFSQ